jgi:hypothetical protein
LVAGRCDNRCEHTPIPVEVARRIAQQFHKSMVVILAYDPRSALTHTTTYGLDARDKEQAADVGDRCAKLICGDGFQRRTVYEDYRFSDAGRMAELYDAAVACGKALEAATATGPFLGTEAINAYSNAGVAQSALLKLCRDLAQQEPDPLANH